MRRPMVSWVLACAILLLASTSAVANGEDEFRAGLSLFQEGDHFGALVKWRSAADKGHVQALVNIGLLHANGHGVKQDYIEAMRWYRRAADKGNAEAIFSIGTLHHGGHGVKQDYNEAMSWYRKAADKGSAAAIFSVGTLYDGGLGIEQDYVEAMRWYRRAADTGDTEAMRKIGSYYWWGHGVKRDYTEAMRWYRKAADRGDAEAVRMIGSFYERGHGVTQDYMLAMYWYGEAADKGDAHAKGALKRLTDKFTGKGLVKAFLVKWKAVQKAERLCEPDALRALQLLPEIMRARYVVDRIPKKERYEASKVLVKALMSRHDIIRKTAIRCLDVIYGRTLLYRYDSATAQRRERHHKWLREIEKLRK